MQGSDPQRSAEQATASMTIGVHMQVHGKENPCGHSADYEQWKRRLDTLTQD